ncbi:hypothetical protein AY605_14630 [Acinetobacter sp. SFD]|nr:hypothetical protein AY605_14630 [Acinetobacter sp. SFD]
MVQGDYPLIASPTLAQVYGLASAIFLQKLHSCLQSSEVQYTEQQKYFYHSYEQWAHTLGVYSISTIKRVVNKLKKTGILVVKKLAQNKWLQTNFYSINYRRLSALFKHTAEYLETKIVDHTLPEPELKTASHKAKKSHSPTPIHVAVPSTNSFQIKVQPNGVEGLVHPLHPMAQSSVLAEMTTEKRDFYHQLLKLKVDIHYDDARLDQWLKNSHFIIQKAAYLKDQPGHLKMLWYSPEQLGLTLAE